MTPNRQINCGIFPTIYVRILGLDTSGLDNILAYYFTWQLEIGIKLHQYSYCIYFHSNSNLRSSYYFVQCDYFSSNNNDNNLRLFDC